ncbi:MAG: tyrosine-protein phosphatase [Bacilli bacterium]|nr:tyrosine-protein phosphatase [Bacilli bacterium]
MNKKLLVLEGVKNFRSLHSAGKNRKGKKVIKDRFYRSAALDHLPQESFEDFLNKYKIRRIIDLRTDLEVTEKPDPSIKGVEYYHIPVMQETNNGVARNEEKKSIAERVAGYLELEETYAKLGTEEYPLQQLGKAVRLCLDLDEGAVLWHCSAGKDRTGIIAYLLLKMLDFNMKEIYKDYLLTNTGARRYAWRLRFETFFKYGDRKLARKVWRTFIARKKYLDAFAEAIEKSCGSLENFYEIYCGYGRKDFAEFRKKLLK